MQITGYLMLTLYSGILLNSTHVLISGFFCGYLWMFYTLLSLNIAFWRFFVFCLLSLRNFIILDKYVVKSTLSKIDLSTPSFFFFVNFCVIYLSLLLQNYLNLYFQVGSWKTACSLDLVFISDLVISVF